MKSWLIYGANGYTGKLVAAEAVARGHRPVLAGRTESAVRAVAEPLNLPFRAFDLSRADEFLKDISLVIHCAGPFSATARPMVEACLRAGAHYLDITGEIEILEWVLQQGDRAKKAGVVCLPGSGFDVVPSDCLAKHLSDRLPGARRLELAFTGSAAFSPGTLKTMIENLPTGGKVRRGGKIVPVPSAYKSRTVPFGFGARIATTVPWGDVATAYHSTHIPDIVVYSRVPSAVRWFRFALPLLGAKPLQKRLKKWVDANVPGPDEAHRNRARMFLWGRAEGATGQGVEATLDVAEGYKFTALSSVACAARISEGQVPPGARTPSGAFGADFVQSIPDTSPFVDK